MDKFVLVLAVWFGGDDVPVLSREYHAVNGGMYATLDKCKVAGIIATNPYFPEKGTQRASNFLCIPTVMP